MKGVHQILLCGFMGCGKTSVGQALSFRLRWEFLDTDAMIEKREGKSIPQIFRSRENRLFVRWNSRSPGDWVAEKMR